MTRCLYIIGNGFDLHYGLHTGVDTFKRILASKYIEYLNMNALDSFGLYGVHWGEFEQSLAGMNLEAIKNVVLSYPDYLSDRESDREDCIYNTNFHVTQLHEAVDNSLTDMIQNADSELNYIDPNKTDIIPLSGPIISFNYTNTIEALYGISDIFHIHGLYGEDENLIFGYKDINEKTILPDLEEDYYVTTQINDINEFYYSYKKEIQLNRLNLFLQEIGTIDIVCVYGHSMSPVDSVYFELIDQVLNPAIWKVSCYNCDDPVICNCKLYSFYKKIQMFDFD